MKRRSLSSLVLLTAVLLGRPTFAHAADESDPARVEARKLAKEGDKAFSMGRCDLAIPMWQAAEGHFHAPTLLLRIARCQALLGRVVAATATLETIVAEKLPPASADAFIDAQKQAETELGPVRERIAVLRIEVDRGSTSVEPEVELDELPAKRSIDLRLDPGPHRVQVRAESTTWDQSIKLGDGERRTIHVSLAIDKVTGAVSSQRLVGLIMGGVGLAAMAVGGAFGYSAARSSRALTDVCGADRKQCPPEQQGEIDSLKTRALVADLTIGGGAALFVAGSIVILTTPSPKTETKVRVVPMGLGLGLAGAF